jgi:hypothetical protein
LNPHAGLILPYSANKNLNNLIITQKAHSDKDNISRSPGNSPVKKKPKLPLLRGPGDDIEAYALFVLTERSHLELEFLNIRGKQPFMSYSPDMN